MNEIKTTRRFAVVLVLLALCLAWACSDKANSPEPTDSPSTSTTATEPATSTVASTVVATDGEQEIFDAEPVVELDGTHPIQGRLVYRLSQSPDTLNPLTPQTDLAEKLTRFHLNFKLLERHPLELDAIPWLAASMPEKSADGLVHTWTLKKAATWSDGKPLTASDVERTWKFLNSKSPRIAQACSLMRGHLSAVQSIKALDAKRFAVTYNKVVHRADMFFGLNFSPIPSHVIPEKEEDLVSQRYLPGSGPYRVKIWQDNVIHMERIEDWWGNEEGSFKNRYTVKDFVYKVVPDTKQAIEQLKSGAIDFAALSDIKAYVNLMKSAKKYNLSSTHYYLPQWSYIGFNCSSPIFADRRVRKAISLLIPRKAINKQFYEGLARPISGPFFASSIFNNSRIKADTYDPLKAKNLLEAAGWVDRDKDGFLDKDGEKLSFVLSRTKAGLAWSENLLEKVRDSLAQAGIDMEIETLLGSVLYPSYRAGQHQAYAEVWSIDTIHPEVDIRATFHSSECSSNGLNWQQFRSPKLDLLIEKFIHAESDVVRIRSARKIHQEIAEATPMAFLFNNPACIVWSNRVSGVQAYPLGVRQWDFKVKK
ncbi:MAG: peptide/nickel transport system substrate-binding protein [Planctomycetota bacterium]|jgi:peptide/nickel transport system substrate-binding protein